MLLRVSKEQKIFIGFRKWGIDKKNSIEKNIIALEQETMSLVMQNALIRSRTLVYDIICIITMSISRLSGKSKEKDLINAIFCSNGQEYRGKMIWDKTSYWNGVYSRKKQINNDTLNIKRQNNVGKSSWFLYLFTTIIPFLT